MRASVLVSAVISAHLYAHASPIHPPGALIVREPLPASGGGGSSSSGGGRSGSSSGSSSSSSSRSGGSSGSSNSKPSNNSGSSGNSKPSSNSNAGTTRNTGAASTTYRRPITAPYGTYGSSTNPITLSLLASGFYEDGVLRNDKYCDFNSCSGQTASGDAVDCQTDGTWLPITAADINNACTHLNASNLMYNQTQNLNGSDFVNEQGKAAYVLWTVQYSGLHNGTAPSCESALGTVITACQGKHADTEGGTYTAADGSVGYGVDPQSASCDC